MQRTHKTHILKKLAAASAMVVVAGAAFAQATTPAPAPTTPPAAQGSQGGPQGGPRGDMGRHHGGPGHHGGMWLKSVDTDGDGAISKAEADAMFAKIDTNKDGKLDKSELAAYRKASMEEHRAKMKAEFEAKFKAADKNNDGALTRDEFKAAFPRMANRFDTIDANRDGKVTTAEVESNMKKMRDEHMKRHGGPGRGPGASAPAVPSSSGG